MSTDMGTGFEPPPNPLSGSGGSPTGPGLARRLVSLFQAPKMAFMPPLRHSLWIGSLAVLMVLGVGQAWLLRDLSREEMKLSFQQSETLSEQQKEEILARMEEGYSSGGRFLLQSIQSVVGLSLVGYLLPALLYLLALNFGLGARASFREVLGVTTFSNLITILKDIILVPLKLSQNTLYVFLSPAAFVDPGNRAILATLDRFDIFTLYRLVLLTFGLAAITGLAPRKTAVPVLILWLAVGLLGLAFWLSPIGKMFG